MTSCFWSFAMGMPLWAIVALACDFPVKVLLGIKGNEWAWQHRRFESSEQFHVVQRIWARWAITLTVTFVVALIVLCALLIVVAVLAPQ